MSAAISIASPALDPIAERAFDSVPEGPMEVDAPRNGTIVAFVIATIGVIAVVCAGLFQFFGMTIRAEISRKVLEHESSALRELRAEESAKLAHYQWVSAKDGILRIPADRARELTIRDWSTRGAGPTNTVAAPAPSVPSVPSIPSIPPIPLVDGMAKSTAPATGTTSVPGTVKAT